jgi:hypothetical protein
MSSVVEGVLAGEDPVGLRTVDFLDPVGDDQGGDRVAGEVGQGAGLGHEPVDRDDQADAGDQGGRVRREAATEDGQPAPVTPAAPLDATIMKTNRDSCSDQVSGIPRALLMNSEAIVRYIAVPSRLNE